MGNNYNNQMLMKNDFKITFDYYLFKLSKKAKRGIRCSTGVPPTPLKENLPLFLNTLR